MPNGGRDGFERAFTKLCKATLRLLRADIGVSERNR